MPHGQKTLKTTRIHLVLDERESVGQVSQTSWRRARDKGIVWTFTLFIQNQYRSRLHMPAWPTTYWTKCETGLASPGQPTLISLVLDRR